MTLQSKSFELPLRRGVTALQKKLQRWLDDNEEIEVVSTDFATYGDRIAYLIVFREPESCDEREYDIYDDQPQIQPTGPIPGGAPVQGALKESEIPLRGIGANALFGNFEAFNKK